MANIALALKEVFKVEFNNNPDDFVHKNAGEEGYTVGGIYQKANPTQMNWNFIYKVIELAGLKRASRMLYYDTETMNKVMGIYYNKYWSQLRLDEVESQKVANEIFIMGVVGGIRQATILAQRTVGVLDDGILGNKTLGALNAYDEGRFDYEFDKMEINYFEGLVRNKPHFEKFLNGWKNRSVAV